MTKRMLIDSSHPEETRVVVLDGNRLEEFDVETSTKKQIKGNVYLAKVVRVEPSLQAAFVEYGGNRHGFLAFSEIHPDYYQIPVADRQALIAEQEARQRAADDDDDHHQGNGEDGEDVEVLGGEETVSSAPPSIQAHTLRNYKIQEVIKRRQIMLVQVVKEERGNKGAALTTYLSLAGRYCVFMPNTARGGGVSRKISNQTDRRRLKAILGDLQGPAGGSVILRTAGAERSKAEIKRDFDFLMRQWEQIRATTMQSIAPALIHEEGNLIKRAMRDIYTRDIEEIIVDGDEGYRGAKDFMKMLTPSHARKVQPYRDQFMPLFHRFQVESQLDAMHSPVAHLKSGGYLVINQTEALVAIDVNSGKATKERHIEETALKTNLEAADEVARELRLRDLAGLIVIDFIDMDDSRNNAAVERRLKEALKQDRARIQVGRISAFGLMEMSRQRLRPSLMETAFHTCEHCHGTGVVRSTESTAIQMLRVIEEEGVRRRSSEVTLKVPIPVALYILNNKRTMLAAIEERYDFRVVVEGDDNLIIPDYTLDRVQASRTEGSDGGAGHDGASATVEARPETTHPEPAVADADTDSDASSAKGGDDETDRRDAGDNTGGDDDGASRSKKRRRRRRRPRRDDDRPESNDNEATASDESDTDTDTDDTAQTADDTGAGGDDDGGTDAEADGSEDGDDEQRSSRSRRSRRRRGGRRNRSRKPEDGSEDDGEGDTGTGDAGTPAVTPADAPVAANEDDADADGSDDGANGDAQTADQTVDQTGANHEASDGPNDGEGVNEGAVALMEATETEWEAVPGQQAVAAEGDAPTPTNGPVEPAVAEPSVAEVPVVVPEHHESGEGASAEDVSPADAGPADHDPADHDQAGDGVSAADGDESQEGPAQTNTESSSDHAGEDAETPVSGIEEPGEPEPDQGPEPDSQAESDDEPDADPEPIRKARRGWWQR